MNYTLILIQSTTKAMLIIKILQKNNINCRTIPTPKKISSDCGVSVRFETNLEIKVKEVLNSNYITDFKFVRL